MKAVILAAGKSTRTYPLTVNRAKPMLPILDGTILRYTLNLLRDMKSIEEVILVVHHMKDELISEFGDAYKGMSLSYVDQEEPLGTGHAVLMTEYKFSSENSSFLVVNGDDIYSRSDVENLMKQYPSVAVRKVDNPKIFGIFEAKEKEGSMIATGLEEKPEHPKSDLANLGCYHLDTSVFKYLKKVRPSKRGEIELTDAIRRYIDWDDISLIQFKDRWIPVGYPWDLLTANEALMGMREKGEPKPIISEDVDMKKGVTVTGSSIIQSNVRLGADVSIDNSIIMEGAQISSGCRIIDSIVGKDVRIEKNVVTKSINDGKIFSHVKDKYVEVNRHRFGCAIGDGARISKNAEISPGVKIWPGLSITNVLNIEKDIEE